MAGTYKIYISAVDIEVETEAAGYVEKVIPADGFGDDKAVGDAIEDDDKVISSPEWSEKVVSRSEGENYGDVTFILAQDTHYGATNNAASVQAYYDGMLTAVTHMNDIVGEAYDSPLTGVVATPSFVIHPGDILDDSSDYPTSLTTFIRHFGSDGTDGILNYPVYLTRGNHDSHAAIKALILSRHGDYKYRFEFAGIHFICLDTFPQGTGESYVDSNCSQTWLAEQLNLIGKNDRIVLFQHYDYETLSGFANVPPDNPLPWWSTTDGDELLTLITGYNVIGILFGHNHGSTLPGDLEVYEPFRTYNTISAYNNSSGITFWVIRITDTKFQAANWNPYSLTPGWIGTREQNNTITSRVTYGADKVVAADGFGNDKEIS